MQKKKKSYCAYCGKEIKWIRSKELGRAIPVVPTPVFFVPDPTGHAIIGPDGAIRHGRLAPDGLRGYAKHICAALPNYGRVGKPLTEKEMERRMWA